MRILLIFIFMMIVIPMSGIFIRTSFQTPPTSVIPNSQSSLVEPQEPVDEIKIKPIPQEKPEYSSDLALYDISEDKVYTMNIFDYVAGSVSVELPATFDPDTLAAQAVAAHTYARYNQMFNKKYPNPALKGADFSVDPKKAVAYIPKEQVQEIYGESFDQMWEKITTAAQIGVSHIVEYEDAPILAAYHATSAGMTEDAINVWSNGFDYLVPVSSPGDMMTKGYRTAVEFEKSELKKLLLTSFPKAKLGIDYKNWIIPEQYSDSGYITKVKVGDLQIQGKELRTALNLRSTNFTISYKDNRVIITTIGYGHGVGLSQNGAEYMAKEGSDFIQILEHYYPNTVVRKLY